MKVGVHNSWLNVTEALALDLFSRASSQKLSVGDVLFRVGEDGSGCYRLDKGALKVMLTSPRGEEHTIALLTPVAIVGDLSMIDGLPRSATVMAMTDCELLFVSRLAFVEFTKRHPEIYHCLTDLLASRLRETDQTIAALTFLTWRGRVARALLEIANALGKQADSGEAVVERMVNQRELAAMAGVARENVNRVLSEWKRRGIVSYSDGRLQIHDKSALKQELEW